MKEGKWLGALAGAAALAACSPQEKVPQDPVKDTSAKATELVQASPDQQRFTLENRKKIVEAGIEVYLKQKEEIKNLRGTVQNLDLEDSQQTDYLERLDEAETKLDKSIADAYSELADITRVDLSGTTKQRVSPENPDSDPTTVVLEGTKPVRVDPVNPHSKPVEVILKGTKPVRVNPVNPHSKPTRVNL